MSYPIDTIRRRMMMTSGSAVKYKNSLDCGMQVMKNEGFMSLMKGAGANILRGVAGAGVFAGSMLVTSSRGPVVKERDADVYGDHHYGLPMQKLCRTSSNLVDLSMIVRL